MERKKLFLNNLRHYLCNMPHEERSRGEKGMKTKTINVNEQHAIFNLRTFFFFFCSPTKPTSLLFFLTSHLRKKNQCLATIRQGLGEKEKVQ